MKKWLTLALVFTACCLNSDEATVHSHDDLKLFSMYGNNYREIATKATGAKEFEVWRASLAVGVNGSDISWMD